MIIYLFLNLLILLFYLTHTSTCLGIDDMQLTVYTESNQKMFVSSPLRETEESSDYHSMWLEKESCTTRIA